jgi:hypothetical protein
MPPGIENSGRLPRASNSGASDTQTGSQAASIDEVHVDAIVAATLRHREKERAMMGSFLGKVAFITGSGSGIGRASARMLAAEGAQVVIADLKPDAGRETVALIRDAGGDAFLSRRT